MATSVGQKWVFLLQRDLFTWIFDQLMHPVGSTRISDWRENSFIMVVYENIFFIRALDRQFWLNF